ncbi:hypothetical protein SK128_000062 [Halocaridina rubra]|uniref:Uncharacterized protein n=1 Tax=Halocaridina rubra TaxID=373956 RepID=A0AAN8WN71_HALRR
MENDITYVRGPEGQRVVVIPAKQPNVDTEDSGMVCSIVCIILFITLAIIFVIIGGIFYGVQPSFNNTLSVVGFAFLIVAGVCIMAIFPMCCAMDSFHDRQVQRYMHIDDPRSHDSLRTADDMYRRRTFSSSSSADGSPTDRNPREQTSSSFYNLQPSMSRSQEPSALDVRQGSQTNISGRVSPYQVYSRDIEILTSQGYPSQHSYSRHHEASALPGRSSSPVRHTDVRPPPSHSPSLSQGRMQSSYMTSAVDTMREPVGRYTPLQSPTLSPGSTQPDHSISEVNRSPSSIRHLSGRYSPLHSPYLSPGSSQIASVNPSLDRSYSPQSETTYLSQ